MSVQETYLAAIADAIREKEGSTEAIPAKEFAARILALDITPPEPAEPLPDNAQRVEYVEFNYQTSVDTDIIPTPSTTKIEMDISLLQLESSLCGIFQTDFTTNSSSRFYLASRNNEVEFAFGTSAKPFSDVAINQREKFIYDNIGKKASYGNDEINNFNPSSIAPGGNMYLGKNMNRSPSYSAKYRLYSCKIFSNSILQRDFVPCVKSDGTAALYDNISKQFFVSSGTAALTAGPVIS